ncbi:MAG: sigma-70 family RNA polymerase sigma factor [Oscillospiraceae bacterium]|nr:sigma-70 family RNA polymerase sigma factor [Oscillospiraceae bacterium]
MKADKKWIFMNGQLIEVTDEVYEFILKSNRKIRYYEKDLKTQRIIVDKTGQIVKILPSREDSLDRLADEAAVQFPDPQENVEEAVLRRLSMEQLHRAIARLQDEEQQLIEALFFRGMTEREYAEQTGLSQPAVHKQKRRILEKLKVF